MKVLFFARLREALGAPLLEIPTTQAPATVSELRRWLQRCEHAELAVSMADPNVICAVNQRVVTDDHQLVDGDEIAFYPPVTGG